MGGKLLIKTKKGEICPLCAMPMRNGNYLVRYHVRYSPPIEILACRFCNYTEYVLRTGKVDRVRCATDTRIFAIKSFHFKFGVIL